LWSLHYKLREWYYDVGGLYLSENARARYGDMQELLDVYLAPRSPDDDTPVPQPSSGKAWEHSPYKALMESCSAFRTALTEDLATRRSRSILWTIIFWWRHLREGRRAAYRLTSAKRHRAVSATGTPLAPVSSGVAR
jgi:hypothetical protein